MSHNYFVYITTNPSKTTLYTGVTNDLFTRMSQHRENKGNPETFAGKYHCHKLVYYEQFSDINYAIEREKEIKDYSREKKEALINSINPRWNRLVV
ncbi:MAG TPA: GIY-YIG nuclease family protein [Cytophagaceae bacterium]|nr:GIY-YIG nuclease family protein [Cytophagaceae bacterium]